MMGKQQGKNKGEPGDAREEDVITTTEVTVHGKQAALRDREPGAVIFRIGFPQPRRRERDPERDQQDIEGALVEAREAYKRLLGKTPAEMDAEFEQAQARAEELEAQREKEMEELGREKFRAVADSGVLAFQDFFPNGFTDTCWKPFVEGVDERGFVLSNVYVKVVADGRPFLYIVYRPKAKALQEFGEETRKRINELLTGHVFAWTNLYDNRDTPGGVMTVNGPMPRTFWTPADERAKNPGQSARHNLKFTNAMAQASAKNFMRVAVEPDQGFLERRRAKAARDAAKPRTPRPPRSEREVRDANLRDRREQSRY